MNRILPLATLLTATVLASCQSNQSNNPLVTPPVLPESSVSAIQEEEKLAHLVEQYRTESFEFSPISATFQGLKQYNDKFGPIISKQNRQKQRVFENQYFEKINHIDSSKLKAQALLTYKIFKGDREQSLASSKYPFHLAPINQMNGMHNFYAVLGSGQSAQPFSNEKDYRNFMKRSLGFAEWMESVVQSMKLGVKKGVVLPRSIVEKLIPQLKAHVVDNIEDSVFYSPLQSIPEDITGKARQNLKTEYSAMIEETIVPAYRKTLQYISTDYLAHSRKSVGLSDLPNGKSWYEYMIQVHTTLPLTAEEIHNFGLSEVSRILSEMKKVKHQVSFKGNLAEFFNFLRTDDQFYFEKPEELIHAYEQTKSKIDATLPKLFEVFPQADYVVKPVPDFQAASSAGASYQSPSPDGSRPGIFYINTYNMKSQPKFIMETLSIHEAAPGHHFQIAIQQEVEGLPSFRKYGGYTVFNEGWALYAESLGKELGLFTDPYMWYGRLVDEQLRAMRLVVDTGLHSFGWSRERAIQYMLDNSSMAKSDVESEVERYIVMPGQALAYKVGQRKIRELRSRGEKLLGKKFDIKKFHTQILVDGSLPMPILDEKMEAWFQSIK
ncbi:MAG: DUF885 domain-containing protein [Kangiellaceae bacterium]|nr:DUF885 domain-containing protein [Kangiellaceae bacterium]